MPSDDITELLREDFDAQCDEFEHDEFLRRTLFKLESKRRARLGLVACAGGVGAAFAAAQFSGVAAVIGGYLLEATPEGSALPVSTIAQFAAMGVFAGALALTGMVMRQE